MIYLKKFNESDNNNLDFDTFKEIMYEITDEYDGKFNDYSDDIDGPFYDCDINIMVNDKYYINDDVPYLNYDFLDLPHFDDPQTIEGINVSTQVDEHNRKLLELKNDIDSIIENNNKIKKLFFSIKKHILPRLKTFSNFHGCYFGWETDGVFRVTFEITRPDPDIFHDSDGGLSDDDWY